MTREEFLTWVIREVSLIVHNDEDYYNKFTHLLNLHKYLPDTPWGLIDKVTPLIETILLEVQKWHDIVVDSDLLPLIVESIITQEMGDFYERQ